MARLPRACIAGPVFAVEIREPDARVADRAGRCDSPCLSSCREDLVDLVRRRREPCARLPRASPSGPLDDRCATRCRRAAAGTPARADIRPASSRRSSLRPRARARARSSADAAAACSANGSASRLERSRSACRRLRDARVVETGADVTGVRAARRRPSSRAAARRAPRARPCPACSRRRRTPRSATALIFSHAAERRPGLIGAVLALGDDAFEARCRAPPRRAPRRRRTRARAADAVAGSRHCDR